MVDLIKVRLVEGKFAVRTVTFLFCSNTVIHFKNTAKLKTIDSQIKVHALFLLLFSNCNKALK